MDWVAIYAALVATLALGWRVFEWISQRPKIKVKLGYENDLRPRNHPSFIVTTAMNIGRHPITICSTGLHISGLRGFAREMDYFESEEFKSKDLPRRLNEGEKLKRVYECEVLKKMLQQTGHDASLDYAWFRDVTDHIYRAKFTKSVISRIIA